MSMLNLQQARKAFATKLAEELPPATRAYIEALDAKCLRLLRCEPAPVGETYNLDRLLNNAQKRL